MRGRDDKRRAELHDVEEIHSRAHSFDNSLSDTKDTAPTIFGYLWHSNVDDSWLVAVSKDRQFVKYVVPVL